MSSFFNHWLFACLQQQELLLYVFLVLATDRYRLSYYSDDRICSLLQLSVEQYITARDGLIKKDLIAFDGTFFQVLDLPQKPLPRSVICRRSKHENSVPFAQLIEQSLKANGHE